LSKTGKNILFVFTAFTFSKIVGAFTSFALPKILEPESYGVWVTLLLIISYSPILAFGTVEALLRQYPYYIGKGEDKKAREIERSVAGSIVISAAILLIAGYLLTVVFNLAVIETYLLEIRLIFVTAVICLFSAFLFHRFAAHQVFYTYGIVDSLRAVITLLIVCSFAWIWGLRGAVSGYLVTEIIVCCISAYLSKRYCGSVTADIDSKRIWSAIKIGFPITIIWWVMTLQTSVDRVISAAYLGAIQTGYYGLGISIVSMLLLVPQAMNRVLYPRINMAMGQQSHAFEISKLVIYPVRILSITTPLLIGVLIIMLPLIYNCIFPKYIPGVTAAQILLLSIFFVGLSGNGINYLIANNKQMQLLAQVTICLAVNAITAFLMVRMGYGIEGIAISTCIAAIILASLIWTTVFDKLGYTTVDKWKELLSLCLPIIALIALVGTMKLFLPSLLDSKDEMTIVYALILTTAYAVVIAFVPPLKRSSRELIQFIRVDA
jgi:O-antigen/teichoic acid export membrane protein